MTRSLRVAALAALLALAGCASPDVATYATEKPTLLPEQYFNGRVDAWGMFTDRSGKVVKRFVVTIDGRWSGDEGVLAEDFTYADGTKQQRTWRIRKLGDGRYVGRADDVVGDAQGEARGNALHWTYTLALPVDGRTWNVEMDDWMYLMDDHVLLNRTAMSKFGVRLGEVTISFRKRP
ncbi:DUF3833 domain-containing protein [Ramlibacter albus]|uniref:DUF3833 domain-containing protein n=1 Tax=Ramlibacter albus TaxID=2079448 RepID=A0A923M989_9BURK|nr:DUF3833 domain-containing protein [Ramlibacter albus]MBC5765238.1 DUF3833 domain-containing protein [Ramlibacter albus]